MNRPNEDFVSLSCSMYLHTFKHQNIMQVYCLGINQHHIVLFQTNTPKHSSYLERNQKYPNAFHNVWVTPSLFKTLCGHQIKENSKALLINTYLQSIAPKQYAYLLCQYNIYRLIEDIPTDKQTARKFFPRTKKLSYQKCMYMALKYTQLLHKPYIYILWIGQNDPLT